MEVKRRRVRARAINKDNHEVTAVQSAERIRRHFDEDTVPSSDAPALEHRHALAPHPGLSRLERPVGDETQWVRRGKSGWPAAAARPKRISLAGAPQDHMEGASRARLVVEVGKV